MAIFRAYKNRPKNKTVTKVLAETNAACSNEECPSSPDLLLLRDAAADERTSIAFYLDAARNSCLPQLFLDIAEDEMEHYVEIMREVSRLDPVQADIFRAEGLSMLLANRPLLKPQAKTLFRPKEADADSKVPLPGRKDIPTINLLTKALTDELQAVNKYQQYMQDAENSEVQVLFCHLMNEEKEHVAQLTAALFELTHEPLPPEHN